MNLTFIPHGSPQVRSLERLNFSVLTRSSRARLFIKLGPLVRMGLLLLSLVLGLLAGSVQAQTQNSQTSSLGNTTSSYTVQCANFYRAKDYLSARGQCQLAATDNPQDARAWQLLTASALALEDYSTATRALTQAQSLAGSQDETRLLEAELNLAQNSFEAALSVSDSVRQNSQRKLMVRAKSLDALERKAEAIEAYRLVLSYFPTDDAARVALAQRLLEQQPDEALIVLERGTGQSADLLAQQGYTEWAKGEGQKAILTLEKSLDLAAQNPRTLSPEQRVRALTALSMAYYGAGEFGEGNLVLQQLGENYNLLGHLLEFFTPFLLPLLLLLLLHLFGESRIEPLSTLEFDEGQRPWTVSSVYRILLVSLLGGLVMSMVYGSALYSNLLALWTPLQRNEALPIFYFTFAMLVFALTWQSLRSQGWKPNTLLFAPYLPQNLSLGILTGIAWAFVSVLYANLTRSLPQPWNGYFLPLELPSFWLIFALLALPLTEPFWRAYAFTPLEKRYERPIAVGILVCLYGLIFGVPLPLMLLEGALLMGLTLYKRNNSSTPAMAMRFTLYISLGVVAFLLPAVRVWF